MKVSIKNCTIGVELDGSELRRLDESAKEMRESLEGYITALLLEI